MHHSVLPPKRIEPNIMFMHDTDIIDSIDGAGIHVIFARATATKARQERAITTQYIIHKQAKNSYCRQVSCFSWPIGSSIH